MSDDVLDIFNEAAEISDATQRAAFLDKACGNNTDRRRKVADLLTAHEEMGDGFGFLTGSSSGTNGGGQMTGECDGHVGPYKLLQKIGEGGWGIVYMAEQSEPVRRRVALKVLRPGVDTRQVIARFEAERQALAMMDHPNIARVLDAGATENGRPYFVMELVRGIRITDYCDKNRLTTEERLELFISVCQAVQHAHQKGIIHRDIKPSNILVTSDDGKAAAKVIDFGVAKATADVQLTDKTLFTRFEMFVGTPAYMSPEQAEFSAQGVDTRTDIYALGVLLYELLTGQTPFDSGTLISSGVDAMRRTIREQNPQRPSTRLRHLAPATIEAVVSQRQSDYRRLVAQVQGDLDWIVLKALEKDRTRRYETANGMALDVQRFLHNEPIAARPPSTVYAFRKWARRHRAAFIGVTAVLLALLLGVVVSTWQMVRATRAEKEQRELRVKSDADRAAADAARNEALIRAYASDMKAVSIAIAGGNFGEANNLLDRHVPAPGQPDVRGFEWAILRNRAVSDEIASFDHTGINAGVALARDNSWVAAAAKFADVRVWDTATGKLVHTFPALKKNEGRRSIALSPDGAMLAYLSDESIWVRGTKQWEVLREIPATARLVAFAPDGRLVWGGATGGLHFLNPLTFAVEAILPGPPLDNSSVISFTADTSMVCVLTADKKVEVWDVSRKTMVTSQTFKGFSAAAISPDGRLAAIGSSDGVLYTWDLAGKSPLTNVKAHALWLMDIAFSSDSKRILTAGGDQAMCLWDVSAEKPEPVKAGSWHGHLSEVWTAQFSADGKKLVTGGKDAKVKLWNTEPSVHTPLEIRSEGSAQAVGFSADSTQFRIRKPDRIQFYRAKDATPAGEWMIPPDYPAQKEHYSRDHALFCTANGGVAMHQLPSGALSHSIACKDRPATKVSGLSADDRILATVGGGPSWVLTLWDFQTGAHLADVPDYFHEPSSTGKTRVTFAPDGHRVAYTAKDFRVMVYDLRQHAGVYELTGFPWFVYCVAWSPDGRWLATSGWDGVVSVWDPETGQRAMPALHGHFAGVPNLTFSPDSRTLVTHGSDISLRFWNLPTGTEVFSLSGAFSGPQCPVSPDGRAVLWRRNADGTFQLERIP